MEEFEALLKSVSHSYDDFVIFCMHEFADDDERRTKLIEYIKSKDHENPSDIIEYIADELLVDKDEEEIEE